MQRTSTSDELKYVHTDHLGSITALSSTTGALLEQYSYDAWGRHRSTTNWLTLIDMPTTGTTLRGYTGHEHLPELGLINMNARIYDPQLGMFISLDKYIQSPTFAQNFNRYSYCVGNPLMLTDPDGDFFWFIPLAFAAGNLIAHAIKGDVNSFGDAVKYVTTGALAGAALTTVAGLTPLISTIASVYTYSQSAVATVGLGRGLVYGVTTGDWTSFRNAGKIALGNFYLDEKRPDWGIRQGISRHSYEIIQTFAGHSFAQGANIFGYVRNVEYFGGVTLANHNVDGRYAYGMTLGSFVFGRNLRASVNDITFMHEYGHTIQSSYWGFAYIFGVGIPSGCDYWLGDGDKIVAYSHGIGIQKHETYYFETFANDYASRYFKEHYNVIWDNDHNPCSDFNY